MKFRSLAVAGTAVAALAFPASSLAVGTTDTVAGTTLGSLSIAVGVNPGFGTAFAPGASLTDNGTLIITSTNPTWTLQAKDSVGTSGTAPGKLKAITPGTALCANSEDNLQNALGVHVTATGVTDPGAISLTGALQDVAKATVAAPLPIAAGTLNTAYSQSIGTGETLAAGCVYTADVSYTLQ